MSSIVVSIGVLLLAVYLLCGLLVLVMANAAIPDKSLRRMFILIGLATPPLALWATIKTIFAKRQAIPYNRDLARIEDEIEAKRVEIFGVQALEPSISEFWKRSWTNFVENAAKSAASTVGSRLPILFERPGTPQAPLC